jgi:hypothetical protein
MFQFLGSKMLTGNRSLRLSLLAGASIFALAVASQDVNAADLPPRMAYKAPPPAVVQDTWTWWVEGGAFGTGGTAVNAGFAGFKPNWGPEGAVGFDWKAQAFAPWHVSAQFRYGTAKKSQGFSAATSGTVNSIAFAAKAAGNQDLREDHWLVDFAVGRDFGLGNSNAQWKLGVRVADLRSKLTGNGNFAGTELTAGNVMVDGLVSNEQKSSFLGVGPRFGVEGDTPLGGAWSIDWLAGAAVLFGERKLESATTASVTIPVVKSVTINQNFSDQAAIFNVDAQAGLSYSFNPSLKITANYRFDGYFKALKTFDTNGNVVNVDRFYSGPMLRLTSKF